MNYTLHNGDCLDVMRAMDANSVDTVVCDPPYGLSFMGKNWDHGVPGVAFWQAALQVAKPGAMLLAFGGTRTHHRLMVAIEDAGWEIRDVIMWVYGSGFPKSHDISKGIYKAAGATREVTGEYDSRNRYDNGQRASKGTYAKHITGEKTYGPTNATAPATSLARDWQGWGTALKPAYEPIIMAMKPLDGTFAQNAARHGVAGLNVDGGRIGVDGTCRPHIQRRNDKALDGDVYGSGINGSRNLGETSNGRWPANLILDEEAARLLDEQTGDLGKSAGTEVGTFKGWQKTTGERVKAVGFGDTGGASRFFYCAKASRREREAGLEGMPERVKESSIQQSAGRQLAGQHETMPMRNHHPTVKPLSLMRYLVRLTATPTGGVVFDPFMGSGTTGIAALQEGRNFIGIELDPGYFAIAKKRIEDAAAQPPLIPHESEPKHEQGALL